VARSGQCHEEEPPLLRVGERLGIRENEVEERIVHNLAGKAEPTALHAQQYDEVSLETLRRVHGAKAEVEPFSLGHEASQMAGPKVPISTEQHHRCAFELQSLGLLVDRLEERRQLPLSVLIVCIATGGQPGG